jgi:molybdenum cofactor cytidylyltransferase
VISGLILAAGTSSRLGRPKQLLELGGRPLLQHVVDTASEVGCLDEVLVVLGHRASEVEEAIQLPPGARAVSNDVYAEGQSTSIRKGLDEVAPASAAVVVLLGDQPGVGGPAIRGVVEAYKRSGAVIVRARYADGPGHPVLLARPVWPLLRELDGDVGARAVMSARPGEVEDVPVEGSAPADVDTWEQYDLLRRRRTWR